MSTDLLKILFVRTQVARLYSGLPPFMLNPVASTSLYSRLQMRLFGTLCVPYEDDLRLLSQQACLSSALQALSEDEGLSYLKTLRPWNACR